MNFGEKFTQLVNGSNLSRRKLAQELGFGSPGSIDYYMKRDKLPGYDVLNRICQFFGVSAAYFGANHEFTEQSASFQQNDVKYVAQESPIPILSDETESAVQTGVLNLSGIGIHSGFVIVVDDRLASLGFQLGSSLYLSTKFDIDTVQVAIVSLGKERFFAKCEKRGNSMVILPLDRTKPPVTVDIKGKDVQIIASLENIFGKPNLF